MVAQFEEERRGLKYVSPSGELELRKRPIFTSPNLPKDTTNPYEADLEARGYEDSDTSRHV